MNPWKTLGLKEGASKEEAKKAYRKLSKKLHPDMPGGDSKKFDRVTKAYKSIKDGTATVSAFNQSDSDIFDNFFHKRKKRVIKTLKVKIVDVINNKKITIKVGNKKIHLNAGDLKNNSIVTLSEEKFKINYIPDKPFKVKGQNLLYQVTIDYLEALQGTTVSVPNLKNNGDDFKLDIKPNVKYGEVISTDFKALPEGKYYVKVIVVPPKEKINVEVV